MAMARMKSAEQVVVSCVRIDHRKAHFRVAEESRERGNRAEVVECGEEFSSAAPLAPEAACNNDEAPASIIKFIGPIKSGSCDLYGWLGAAAAPPNLLN